MQFRFGLLTLLATITTVTIGIGVKLAYFHSANLLGLDDGWFRTAVNIQIVYDVPLLVAWTLGAAFVLKQGNLQYTTNRMVIAALAINLGWTLIGAPLALHLPKYISFSDHMLGIYNSLRSFAGQIVKAITWGLVLVAYFSQQQEIDRR